MIRTANRFFGFIIKSQVSVDTSLALWNVNLTVSRNKMGSDKGIHLVLTSGLCAPTHSYTIPPHTRTPTKRGAILFYTIPSISPRTTEPHREPDNKYPGDEWIDGWLHAWQNDRVAPFDYLMTESKETLISTVLGTLFLPFKPWEWASAFIGGLDKVPQSVNVWFSIKMLLRSSNPGVDFGRPVFHLLGPCQYLAISTSFLWVRMASSLRWDVLVSKTLCIWFQCSSIGYLDNCHITGQPCTCHFGIRKHQWDFFVLFSLDKGMILVDRSDNILVCVCMWVCAHVYVNMWKPLTNLGCDSSGAILNGFQNSISHWPVTWQVGYDIWPASPRYRPISTSSPSPGL